MLITKMFLMAAAVVSSPADGGGAASMEHVTIRVSPDAVSAIRLPEKQKIVDVVLQDTTAVEMAVATDRTIVLTGVVGADGTHLVIRRSTGQPLDVLLLPAPAAARSQIVEIGSNVGNSVPEWHLDGGALSLLDPGFAVLQAYASNGVKVEALPSDGAMVVTGGVKERGDVLLVGREGQLGMYRLD